MPSATILREVRCSTPPKLCNPLSLLLSNTTGNDFFLKKAGRISCDQDSRYLWALPVFRTLCQSPRSALDMTVCWPFLAASRAFCIEPDDTPVRILKASVQTTTPRKLSCWLLTASISISLLWCLGHDAQRCLQFRTNVGICLNESKHWCSLLPLAQSLESSFSLGKRRPTWQNQGLHESALSIICL